MKTPLTSECTLCDGTGWRAVQKGEWRAVEPCSCQSPRRDIDWYMERAQVPPRFRQCSFEDFFAPSDNSSLQMALIKARGFAEQYPMVVKGLLFMGNPGVGKTHLTVAILRHLMTAKGIECRFCSFPDLLEQLQESYDPVALRSKAEILQPVLETEVVAIDDLGARRVTDWVEDTVTYILNYRYNQKKPTILTSNLPDAATEPATRGTGARQRVSDTLLDRIGVRIYSRLFEMCEKVSIQAEDHRQTVRQHTQPWQRENLP
ncbi:MAG: ATP-binding protein [Acidobacteria bacterium]|nr:ATP-binding protein [Acidobacteriota bacterium]